MRTIKYILAGFIFGIILIKSEAVSWYRIQEMFRFESFHMYGLMGSAVFTGMISILLMKKFKAKSIDGETIDPKGKEFNKGTIIGGLCFGFGWAMCGACPGPLYANLGAGIAVFAIIILFALLGTLTYGYTRHKLPH